MPNPSAAPNHYCQDCVREPLETCTMLYENLSDLPESVRNNLPQHAQEIYRAAYNSAEGQYGE